MNGAAGPPSAPSPGDLTEVRSLLGAGRTITKVWVLLGALVGLLSLLGLLLSLLFLRFPLSGLDGLAYAALWVVIDLLVLERFGGWLATFEAGRYGSLREPLLIWGALALLFGVVPGVFLLFAYVRTLGWEDARAGTAGGTSGPLTGATGGPVGAAATSTPPPPPYAGAAGGAAR